MISELDALISVAKVLEPAEEKDVEWFLDLLSSAKTEDHRKADVRLFRRQLIQTAASLQERKTP
jgi:hypothetical protein